MKKLALVVAIIIALGYLAKAARRDRENVAERNAAAQSGAPAVPQPNGVQQVPLKGDPLADRAEVLRKTDSAAQAYATWELQYGAECATAHEKVLLMRATQQTPAQEAERATAEKFITDHCAQWRPGRRR